MKPRIETNEFSREKRPRRRPTAAAFACAAVCLSLMAVAMATGGCAKKPNLDELAARHDQQSRVGPGERIPVKGIVHVAEPVEYRDGVGLRAAAQGNTVVISVHNLRDSAFFLSPTDFAVIVDGHLHRAETGKVDFREFPALHIQPEATVVGTVVFRGLGDLVGNRLVFNNPRLNVQFFVVIEPSGVSTE